MNHNLDIALIGNNYLTYLLALGLIDKGREILILDDKRFNYGERFTENLSQLDVELLKNWGSEAAVAPLVNIDSYIDASPFTLLIGRKQVLLGRSPFKNLRELRRKFPYVFIDQKKSIENIDGTQMNELFDSTVKALGEFLIKDNTNKKLIEFLNTQVDERIRDIFYHFFSCFKSVDSNEFGLEEKNEFQTLIFTSRGLYQNRLGSTVYKSEALHLFLSFLSPNYKLNNKKLKADLHKLYSEKGGSLKVANLDKLNASNGFIERFALESVEGMIRPRKLIFIGGYPTNLPVKLDVKKTLSYQYLKVNAKFTNSFPAHYLKQNFIFSSSIKIGTDRPFWQVEFVSETEANFFVAMSYKEGSKVEFFKELVESIICDDLKYAFAEIDAEIKSSTMSFTHDVLIDDQKAFLYKKTEKHFKKTAINPFGKGFGWTNARTKHVLYLGPYYDSWLGRHSSLLELRRWKQNL